MTEAEAVTELGLRCEAASEPTLSTDELTSLVRRARRVDADDRLVTDADWAPTFDLAWAAWKGWEAKAAKAAASFDIASDGQSLARSQVAAGCREQARLWARQVSG